ncbi:LOW QUALITY PROTEIN: P-selectin glycoprotein ligand 1 [Anoplopoma fimbria]|uniref:LOW QUALITY PROTEIN: P-selectin glycoprotein ligand 1 n=1 Tax=Anoplopoma fimbria TaxID=229290 RepID=UPI0023ED7E4A|nr:LOW QUALITY PROTEIN: P-selectin glycoprotein ligand 1 [Anoplopoma fimbria]
MMQLSMKTYLVLLLGISVLYALETDMSASTTETSSINSTAEPHKPAEISVASQAEITVPHTVKTEDVIATYRSDVVTVNTVAATTSRTEPQLLHTSTAVVTTAGAANPSHNAMILEMGNPTEVQIHQQSPTTPTDLTAPATPSATASEVTVAVSPLQPLSTTKPEVTSESSPITSPENVQTLSGPLASATTTVTADPTSEAAPDPTMSETFTTSTELLSTSELVSVTKTPISSSQFPHTAGWSSTAESPTMSFSTESPISTTKESTTKASTTKESTTNVFSTTKESTTNVPTTKVSTTKESTTNVFTTKESTTKESTTNVPTTKVSTTKESTTNVFTTNISTSPTAILIPRVPKKLPVLTTKSAPVTTTAPRKVSKSTPVAEVKPCSTRHLAKNCLIAVASLAALATVFMVSTIVLCTKLSTRKYKIKKPQPATEMMCISSLLPERNITYSRQRNPVTNGVLVIHSAADSDEDGGDNLTLSSFLPENDRFV